MSVTKKILIVDDEADAIEYIQAVLSDIGSFEFIPAYDGNEALQKAQSQHPDLILLDVMMPEKDGFKVFHELRQQHNTSKIPVIMITGVADKIGIRFFKKDMKEYLGSEPLDYIEKPLEPDKLQSSVLKALQ